MKYAMRKTGMPLSEKFEVFTASPHPWSEDGGSTVLLNVGNLPHQYAA